MTAETIALQSGFHRASFIRNILIELGWFHGELTGRITSQQLQQAVPIILINDNRNTISHLKTTNKHREVRLTTEWYLLRRNFSLGLYELRWIKGLDNLADGLTKPATGKVLDRLRECLSEAEINLDSSE